LISSNNDEASGKSPLKITLFRISTWQDHLIFDVGLFNTLPHIQD
jgi:hypothetical protein